MRTYDFSPLYRSAIGFDRFASLLDETLRTDTQSGYPPYNVELVEEDHYRITMAVAGFAESELNIEVEGDTLKVIGKQDKGEGKTAKTYLHQGIAAREFEQRFQLADHVQVSGAKLENGLLNVDLVREIPEALKPRQIEIEAAGDQPVIEERKAA